MADGNGKSIDGMATPPNEHAIFRIGGRDLIIPALTLWDLEVSRTDITTLTADMPWSLYATQVVRIISRKLNEDNPTEFGDALLKSCSVPEARNLATQFTELLRVSGFEMGEAEATVENPGTGTSTESQQNSLSPSETPTSAI
jgi:hypothetical protein